MGMTEQPEQDVLQTSKLADRLFKRLTTSPGVIDIQGLLKRYQRLTERVTKAHILLENLLTRYAVDDVSAVQHLPLASDQSWKLNLNTYLTNSTSIFSTTYNSSSAITNQFILPAGASAIPPQLSLDLSSSQTSSSSSAEVQFAGRREESDKNIARSEPPSQAQIAGKVRVRRKRADFPAPTLPGETVLRRSAQQSAESPPSGSTTRKVEAKAGTLPKLEDDLLPGSPRGKDERSQQLSSSVAADFSLAPTRSELPVARVKSAHRVQETDDERGERHSAKSEIVAARPQANAFQSTTGLAEMPPAVALPVSPRQQMDHSQLSGRHTNREDAPPFLKGTNDSQEFSPRTPTVPAQIDSTPVRMRATELVFHKGSSNVSQLRELLSETLGNNAPGDPRQNLKSATRQLSQNQTNTQEFPNRHERATEREISPERVLRRISRMLLIERERRGY